MERIIISRWNEKQKNEENKFYFCFVFAFLFLVKNANRLEYGLSNKTNVHREANSQEQIIRTQIKYERKKEKESGKQWYRTNNKGMALIYIIMRNNNQKKIKKEKNGKEKETTNEQTT